MLVAGGLFDVILSMVGGGSQDGVTLRFVSAMHLGSVKKKPPQGRENTPQMTGTFGDEKIICYIMIEVFDANMCIYTPIYICIF